MRYSKGVGGCVGWRLSMVGFGEEDYEVSGVDDFVMFGVLYDVNVSGDMVDDEWWCLLFSIKV